METADIRIRNTAVRPRNEADLSASVHEVTVTFKKDAVLKRIDLGWFYLSAPVPMYLALRDAEGDLSWLVGANDKMSRSGNLPAGGYVQTGKMGGAAMGLINLDAQPIGYDGGNPTRFKFYLAGDEQPVKAGEVIKTRFLTFTGANDLPSTNQWLKKFITGFGIGGSKPDYPFTVRQGSLSSTSYLMELHAENGGATVEIGKYQLPHNLLVAVDGMAANAVAGRFDLTKKQLLILPVLDGNAITSVNTTSGDTNLYVGELFHCENDEILLSCVQDGADKLLLELHNPTDKAITAKLSAVPGFAPLAGLSKSVAVSAFSSVKVELPVAGGTLLDKPHEGD